MFVIRNQLQKLTVSDRFLICPVAQILDFTPRNNMIEQLHYHNILRTGRNRKSPMLATFLLKDCKD